MKLLDSFCTGAPLRRSLSLRVSGAILLSVLCGGASRADERALFPRHPALSADGSQVAFSYAGDIWTVAAAASEAKRLTVHPGYEHSPRWSPDGRWIAFSGARESDEDDLFIIPAAGGEVRRLTDLDVDDQVCDWTPDSRFVIFSSRRDDRYPDYPLLYRVALEGGNPIPITRAYADEARISPDGGRILVTRLDGQWWRKGYRSSGAPQVWMGDLAADRYQAVTDTGPHATGDDFVKPAARWPLWGASGKIYVTAEWDGTFNIWQRDKEEKWSQLTSYEGDGVRFPTISRDGRLLAFEQGSDIYVMAEGAAPRRLEIIAPLDPRDGEPVSTAFNDRADRLAFTPDGKQMFLEVRGEIVAGRIVGDDDKAARGRANLLSQSNPARDGDFAVSSGGDSLVVVSDRSGNRDLYLVVSDDPDTRELSRALRVKWEPLIQTTAEEHTPRWSPDGKLLAFARGKGDLFTYDFATKQERQLLKGWSLLQYAWSPDSKWVAFAREDDEYNSEIFIIPAAGGREVNVSRHPDEDDSPVWSGDGRKLAFRSRRRDNNWDIYFVFLRAEDHQKSAADFAEELRSKAEKKEKKEGKEAKKEKESEEEPRVEVVIDTTDISKRVRAVTNLTGEEGIFAVSPDGEQFAFTSNHEGETDIYRIKWNGEGLKRLTNGGANPKFLDFDAAGKRVRYLDGGGRVKSIETDGGSAKDHPFDARLTIDRRAERRQKFGEIWRRLGDEFYDPEFHGRDWAALPAKYRPWAEAASCEEDFGDVVRMMFGELNSSHMGYYSPPGGRQKTTGRLGLDFDWSAPGPGLLVQRVLKNGPCDRVASKVLPGDRLIGVAGVKLEAGAALEKLLEDQVGQRVELTLRRGKDELRIIVKPIHRNELGDLRYNEWVDGRRRMVDSLSGGRLGYLHIRGMGEESLARFESELYSVGAGKEGLVVDVRYNGGGWTTDWLLAMLQVRRHATTFPRGGGPGYPQSRLPLYSWVKPIVTLCNEHSFSNAEIFSHAVQTVGRGTLVGVPTPGGVISTDGDGLLDGSSYRIPLRGWFVGTDPKRDSARNMEGHGAVPDLIQAALPGQMAAGNDQQLQAAIGELLSRLEIGTEK